LSHLLYITAQSGKIVEKLRIRFGDSIGASDDHRSITAAGCHSGRHHDAMVIVAVYGASAEGGLSCDGKP